MKYLFVFFISLTLASCYHENIPEVIPPETLLPEEEMINILTDVYIAEGTIAYQKSQKNLPEGADMAYYEHIFEKYNINHRILKENLNYYNSNPKNMESLLEEVLARLSRLQAEIEISAANDTISSPAVDSAFLMLQDSLEQTHSDMLQMIYHDSLR